MKIQPFSLILSLCFFLSVQAGPDNVLEAAASTSSNANGVAIAQGTLSGSLIQASDARLLALYAQREAIAKGLQQLGYDICMASRMTRVGKLNSILSARSQGVKGKVRFDVTYDCLPGTKCSGPSAHTLYGNKVILPLKKDEANMFKKQFKKTQVMERLLARHERAKDSDQDRSDQIGSSKRRPPGKSFHKGFFGRNSCLVGGGLMRACKLLTDRPIKDAKLKRLKVLVDKNEDFKSRYDGELACKIADSKASYVKSLSEVQKAIVAEEREFKANLKKRREVAGESEDTQVQDVIEADDEE